MKCKPQMNVVCLVLDWIFNNIIVLPLVFVIWCLVALIDAFVLLGSSDNQYHRDVRNFYQDEVKTRLTNRPFSRSAFSITHGFLFFTIAIAATLWVWFQFSPSSKIVKTKHITITVTSETQDTIDFFSIYLLPDWSLKKDSLDPWLNMYFHSSETMNSDIAKFRFKFQTNFETEFHPENKDIIKDSLYNNRVWTYDIELKEGDHPLCFLSDASILTDLETPYVNLYLEFNQEPDNYALMPMLNNDSVLTDSSFKARFNYNLIANKGIRIKLGATLDEGTKSDADIFPYDLISVKPEPTTNNPILFNFNSLEKYREVLNKGIYISAVNRDLEAKLEREAFLHSVLIGTLISIVFALIMALLERWKEINKKEGKKDPFDYD